MIISFPSDCLKSIFKVNNKKKNTAPLKKNLGGGSGGIFILSIYLSIFLAALSLRCCVRALVAASGVTLRCGAQASHCGGFSCCRAQALGAQASVVAARGLSSCGS